MSMSVDRMLSMPDDSIGSPFGFVSPWTIDIVVAMLVVALILVDIQGVLLESMVYAGISGLALWAAMRSKAFHRYITDTPRSKIASAAQGFVELQGKCEFFGDREIQGFMSGPPCVWHRYFILRAAPLFVQIGASEIPFVIRDESGISVVDPKGATLVSSSRRSWTSNGKYYSSKYIRHGATMYIVGEIRADGCAVTSYNENAEVGSLLGEWKKDKPWLLEQFDVNLNGELDTDEWASAVKQAKKISRDIFEQKSIERIQNVIRRPRNGMPMLISDRNPDELALQFSRLFTINLAIASVCMLACLGKLL